MLLLLRTWWQNQSSRGPRVALALGVVLGLVLLWSLLAWLPDLLTTRQLTKSQEQLKSEHITAAARGEADHTDYRLDSAKLATQGQALHYQDSTLATSEREILSTRRPRLVLPDASSLPREGAN